MKNTRARIENLYIPIPILVTEMVAKPNASKCAYRFVQVLGFTGFVRFQAELIAKVKV